MGKNEFHKEFLSFRKDLLSYLLRITGNKHDAEDLTQDTYIKASKKLFTFQGKSSLKTWVFTIGTNLARDHHRSKYRWSVECQERAKKEANLNPELVTKMIQLSEKSPAGKYEIKEHIDFCFTCMSKTLPINQQIAVILKDIYNFKIDEIVEITNESLGRVKHALSDGRNTLNKIFQKKCALVSKKGACYQCSELNGIFNPAQNQAEEINKIAMAKEAREGKDLECLYKLRSKLVSTIDPANSQGSDLHNYFLELMPGYSQD